MKDEDGRPVESGATVPDAAGLAALVERVAHNGQPVHAAIESMTGARFVHDQLEQLKAYLVAVRRRIEGWHWVPSPMPARWGRHDRTR